MNILCGYPTHPQNSGQQGWNDGVLATASEPTVLLCPGCTAYSNANPPLTTVNAETLRARAQAALTANMAYLGVSSPTVAQNTAQLQRVTKECGALIRLLLNQLDDITGT